MEILRPHFEYFRRLYGLGTFGSVGVTGIIFGGVLRGRLAAWFANASVTIGLVGTASSDGVLDFL